MSQLRFLEREYIKEYMLSGGRLEDLGGFNWEHSWHRGTSSNDIAYTPSSLMLGMLHAVEHI